MIISEIGQNHLGDMKLARKMIDLSKEGGADLCKFQLFSPEKLYKPDFPLFKEVKQAELSFEQAKMLFDYGASIGMEVFFSVFDTERVKWCEEIGVKRYKIAASMLDINVAEEIESTRKPIIHSQSFNYRQRLDWIPIKTDYKELYCINQYPVTCYKFEVGMFEDHGEPIGEYPYEYDGFSDHTIGLDASKIALARGASIIEKHFCIDHKTGVDAQWSMDFDELKELKRWENICKEVL